MTFDMRKAREICSHLPKYMVGVTASKEEAEAAKFLPAALDEIERQSASLDSAEALIRKNADMINAQAKRIAELDDAVYYYRSLCARKQSAAKELARKYRMRGKALVEERADMIASCAGHRLADYILQDSKKRLLDEAREELRQEKLL